VETKCELVIAKVLRTACLCSHEKGKLCYLVPALGDLLVFVRSTIPDGFGFVIAGDISMAVARTPYPCNVCPFKVDKYSNLHVWFNPKSPWFK